VHFATLHAETPSPRNPCPRLKIALAKADQFEERYPVPRFGDFEFPGAKYRNA
jgi:hypothetical protein